VAHRTAKFMSAIIASVLAGAALTFCNTVSAAPDDCLPGPKGTAPQGQHWYYRLDRGTKRQCWYLRGQDEKATQTVTPAVHARVNSAPRNVEAAPPHSVEDAFAEIPQPQTAPDQEASASAPSTPAIMGSPPAAQSPEAAAQQQQNGQSTGPASRAPNFSRGTYDAAPMKSSPMADARSNSKAAPASNSALPLLPGADVAPAKASGSVQMLLLVIACAMALAGFTASIVFRFGKRRRRRREVHRRVNWEPTTDIGLPPWVADVQQPSVRATVESAPRRSSDLEIDRITELLEQLVRQGPTLNGATPAAGSAGRGQNRQAQSGVRA
jgi:hypothetical protein